jgi:S-ribosylhomocysteine lyase
MNRIASFSVDHDYIVPGMYISRIDGDVITYDLRTRRPNRGDYMSNLTMHSVEHMVATLIRNSEIGDDILYFGPMGCQTGFYLLVRDSVSPAQVWEVLCRVLAQVEHESTMYGADRKECGNWKNLSLAAAQEECRTYLAALKARGANFDYPQGGAL